MNAWPVHVAATATVGLLLVALLLSLKYRRLLFRHCQDLTPAGNASDSTVSEPVRVVHHGALHQGRLEDKAVVACEAEGGRDVASLIDGQLWDGASPDAASLNRSTSDRISHPAIDDGVDDLVRCSLERLGERRLSIEASIERLGTHTSAPDACDPRVSTHSAPPEKDDDVRV